MRKALFWTPRILCLAFAAFTGVFALDVFDGSHGFIETALALAMHLVPTAIILVALLLSWRWEWIGALLFPALGGLYIAMAWGRFPWQTYAAIAGPLLLLGILFGVGWRLKTKHRMPEPAG